MRVESSPWCVGRVWQTPGVAITHDVAFTVLGALKVDRPGAFGHCDSHLHTPLPIAAQQQQQHWHGMHARAIVACVARQTRQAASGPVSGPATRHAEAALGLGRGASRRAHAQARAAEREEREESGLAPLPMNLQAARPAQAVWRERPALRSRQAWEVEEADEETDGREDTEDMRWLGLMQAARTFVHTEGKSRENTWGWA